MARPFTAKISFPRPVNVYPRRRLFTLLDKAKARPVIWIAGPPGSGKTTLVANFIATQKRPHIWYRVDSTDLDLPTFFSYLRLAVEQTSRRKHPTLPLLTPEYLMDVATFTHGYFRNLWARLPQPFVLVFDNYQEIGEDAPLHGLLQAGLIQVPEGSNVIFVSHSEPGAAFARLKANQGLTVIDWKALRFTDKEAGGLVKLHYIGKMPKETQKALYQKTDGWVAGLILMLDQINTHTASTNETTPPLINEKMHATVFDYFLGEIFNRLSPEVRQLLLRTAFFPSVTARMAAQITAIPSAGETLRDLSRRNFFITAHPDGSYRYHDLFRAFLVARACETFTPAEQIQIRYRAAVALEEAGRLEEAVELFRDAKDWAGMIRLILKQAPPLLMQGRHKILDSWLTALPQEVTDNTPWLLHWWGYCRQPFDPPGSRELLEKAHRLFEKQPETPENAMGLFSSWCGIMETFLYEFGDFTRMDSWIALMEKRLLRMPGFPFPEMEARVASTMAFASIYRRPEHSDTRKWVEKSITLVAGINQTDIKMRAINSAALYFAFVGDWPTMGRIIDMARNGIRLTDSPHLDIIGYHTLEAISSWTAGLTERCVDFVEKGLLASRTSGIHVVDHSVIGQGLFASLSAGDLKMASVYLKQMEAISSETRLLLTSQYYYFVAWEAWLKNDLPRAITFSRQGLDFAARAGTPYFEALCRLGLVQVQLTQGAVSDIKTDLKKVSAFGHKMDSNILIYVALLLDAQLKLVQGNEKGVMAPLTEALRLGKKHGYYNAPWWNPRAMASLSVIALTNGIEVDYVQDLIRKRKLYPDSPPLECENWPWPIKIFTLGQVAILKDDQPIPSTRKTPQKALELLYTLIAAGESGVSEDQLIESLRLVSEGDKAHWALEGTLARLRQWLGNKDVILLQGGRFYLSTRHCWVDAWAVERLLGEIETAIGKMSSKQSKQRVGQLAERLFKLYRGLFLGQGPASLNFSYQERLHNKTIRQIKDLGSYWERAEEFPHAEISYQKGLELDPTSEILTQRLMSLYKKLGRRTEAMTVYRHCQQALARQGEEPNDETKMIYRKLQG